MLLVERATLGVRLHQLLEPQAAVLYPDFCVPLLFLPLFLHLIYIPTYLQKQGDVKCGMDTQEEDGGEDVGISAQQIEPPHVLGVSIAPMKHHDQRAR